jgi:hypothetical protein
MGREIQVTFDCADPARLADFWAHALGGVVPNPPDGSDSWDAFLEARGVPPERRNDASAVEDPDGVTPRVFFQRVPEGKVAKNRVHLDLRAAPGLAGDERMAALETVAADLVGHGATRVRRFEPGGIGSGHIVMQDPEENEFCLD